MYATPMEGDEEAGREEKQDDGAEDGAHDDDPESHR